MAGVEAQLPTASTPLLTGYAEVTAAFQIVREVRKNALKWQPAVLNTMLYEDTALARPIPRDGHVGENEVVMKNVYYLATKTQNLSDALVLSLVDAEVLTIDEGNLILEQPTIKLRAVKMYALLVEKEDPDNSIATSVVTILHAHENVDVTKIFAERFNIFPDVDAADEANNQVDGQQEGQEEDDVHENNDVPQDGAQGGNEVELENGQWACKFCTFINAPETNICEVCSKTVDFNLDDSIEVNICPQCTLMNENGAQFCEACGFMFMRDRRAENDNNDGSDDEDEDVPNLGPGEDAGQNDAAIRELQQLINFD